MQIGHWGVWALVQGVAYATAAVALGAAWWRYGRDVVMLAVGAMIYAYILEATFVCLGAYKYSDDFVPMLPGHVPLWVAVGWGTIVFAASMTANRLGMSWWSRPFAAALLALLLDFALDPIAVGLGFWTWREPGTFYQVTWSNFTGWLLIVGSYSFAVEALYARWLKAPRPWVDGPSKRREGAGSAKAPASGADAAAAQGARPGGLRELVLPLVAIVPALLLCLVSHAVLQLAPSKVFGDSGTVSGTVFAVVLTAIVAVIGYSLPRLSRHEPLLPELMVVPVAYFVLFVLLVFTTRLQCHTPELRVWIPLLCCVVVIGYLWPSIDVLSRLGETEEAKAALATIAARSAQEHFAARKLGSPEERPLAARVLSRIAEKLTPSEVAAVAPSIERSPRKS